ncbi:cyclic pyranopterin monophosphate synthase MoaC [Neorhodopirellula pilleata]|uniref:Cyclic pyranopterin monophosphate synthase n=1 Tax=Neorhodopirellula pilleata TaxID=2714738 RepID=A0A5C6ADH4_9BACT|nr:cyclic pyranopterin monophosphate synthase MoaC [Neorhodopirellula pilleata]TWT97490.1 Cyclic pyranopterin monophosphate synthase accessory protein [Neorhodopirellula pilleata]
MSTSTHFDNRGQARMVDVTEKAVTARTAAASSIIEMNLTAAEAIRAGDSRKGDVLAVARLAGIGATKWTPTLIPLCHAIPIEGVELEFHWLTSPDDADRQSLQCLATVRTTYKTGVEMEAMTAASVAALTIYDMLKSVDRAMVIKQIRLESKTGGKSGEFVRGQ